MIFFVIAFIGFAALGALLLWLHERQKPISRKPHAFVDDQPIRSVEETLRCHDIGRFYYEIGAPKEVGNLVEVNMQSGRVAIYQLTNIERASGVDWNWYDFKFVGYKSPAAGQEGDPAGAREA